MAGTAKMKVVVLANGFLLFKMMKLEATASVDSGGQPGKDVGLYAERVKKSNNRIKSNDF